MLNVFATPPRDTATQRVKLRDEFIHLSANVVGVGTLLGWVISTVMSPSSDQYSPAAW
jgi:hypothetical protein